MSQEMFKFTVTAPQDVSKEEFEEFDKSSEINKFISDPGLYELKVVKVTYKGASKSDSTWQNMLITLQNVSGAEIREFVSVPTVKLTYMAASGKSSKFMYSKYKKFLVALGVQEVTQENILSFAEGLFTKNKLIGMSLQGNLQYEGAYCKYHGKNAKDESEFVLVNKGDIVCNEDGSNEIFLNRQAVEAKAMQLGITDYSPFISINSWGDCPNPDQIKSKKSGSGSGW